MKKKIIKNTRPEANIYRGFSKEKKEIIFDRA